MTVELSMPSMIYGVDVDAVASALLDCSSVMGLGDEIATYLGGRRIAGIEVRSDEVQVHVLGRYGLNTENLCAHISAVLMPLVPGKHINIAVIDMVEPYPLDLTD